MGRSPRSSLIPFGLPAREKNLARQRPTARVFTGGGIPRTLGWAQIGLGGSLVVWRRETYPPYTVLADGDLGLQIYTAGYHPEHPEHDPRVITKVLLRGIEIWRYLLGLGWKSGTGGGGDVLR
ncbi:hypothetical protein GUJ93_ZPchr0004g40032 [Zizania palustris]|uniref:Uncharacterized protein n=1 Tax=Zizania palustris TaxID=103762 RepID=A0A8J5SXM0_ZIZPA|nr:hypothetical protein GUJ93_ZPchr0004g40032 [Zizania palustris]